mmetsp:Transcript_23108/g.54567  ORF Transcript_23108/g.54567 Transcript_23108/m.54567 type:complete len:191 (+) Transcript_23108:97-669(+)
MHTAPQIPLAFCSHNYNKAATIPGSAATAVRHHPHNHQSKEAAHRRNMMRKRSSMIAGSSNKTGLCSQRSSIKQNHRRSLRYTRTLDIILEETQQQPQNSFASAQQSFSTHSHIEHQGRPSCDSPTTTVMTTDYWHSMKSLKKSATTVSLDSLLSEEDNDNNSRQIHTSGSDSAFEDEDDYNNFLDDWDL